jgi:hypothetical protein
MGDWLRYLAVNQRGSCLSRAHRCTWAWVSDQSINCCLQNTALILMQLWACCIIQSIHRWGWQNLHVLPFLNSCWSDVANATKDYFETFSEILVTSVWFACMCNRRLNTWNIHALNYFCYAQMDLAINMQIISAYILQALHVQWLSKTLSMQLLPWPFLC